MSRITQRGATAAFDLFKNDTDASDVTYIGQKFDLADGREVTLVSVGGSNIVSGVLVQGKAIVADNQNLAVAASASVGSYTMTVTLGSSAVTANQYQGGFVVINASAGIGQTLRIASHPAANGSASLVLTLEDPIQVALTTSSKACLHYSPYSSVVINPTTATATPVGVTLYPLTASAYGYVVSKGITSCLSDANTATVGLGLIPSTTTAGTVAVATATGACIGRALQATVSAEARAIYVNL